MVSGTVADQAGNATSTAVLINLDKTPPVLTGASFSTRASSGWNKSDVVVVFNASDSLSGVMKLPTPVTLSTEGDNQSVLGTATDFAGNIAQPKPDRENRQDAA